MIRTRITQMFGIQHPVIQGGMAWVSPGPLAAAVSAAGGLGVIGGASMTKEQLRAEIRYVKDHTDKPYGVNIPAISPNTDELTQVCVEEKVRIAFTAAGNPKKLVPPLKDAGITVFHVTASPPLAEKCIAAGVDGLVLEGWEAAGHVSTDEVTTIALTPMVRSFTDLPIIAGGGIANGKQMAAVLALGADAVQFGSRFVCAEECAAHPKYKEAMVQAPLMATTVYCKRYHPGRALATKVPLMLAKMDLDGVDPKIITETRGLYRGKMGCLEGDSVEGLFPAGISSGLIRKIQPAGEIVAELMRECEAAIQRLATLRG